MKSPDLIRWSHTNLRLDEAFNIQRVNEARHPRVRRLCEREYNLCNDIFIA